MSQIIPQHVAIVMDGNGRWAENQGLPRLEGHRAGVEAVRGMVETCLKKKISTLSLFAFSRENWARPVDEVNFLMDLFIQSLDRELDALHEQGVRLMFIGNRAELSDILQTAMQSVEQHTENNQVLILNIVINYGGRWDITQATRVIAERVQSGELLVEDINEDVFSDTLATRQLPEPDLFIRTSGECRISNFFLWQLAYCELYFTKIHWPDFTVDEFEQALTWFATRERRYGKTSKQIIEENEENHV
ncbi:MAG: polyprenyl diphosphate synthase [Legionellaceae bacterium]|nr:polyprenyl diphosphate synthase [Legionellaceae bacterium]